MRPIPLVVSVILAGAPCMQAGSFPSERDSLLAILPSSDIGEGWLMTDTVQTFREKELYLYIDGGAELFLEYGFRLVMVAEYRKGETSSIILEVYQMNDAPAAFGIYSVRSGDRAGRIDIGTEGCTDSYYIMYWKDNVYVSVTASDSSAECRRGLETIARLADQKISRTGEKPAIVQSLPDKGLWRCRYFRGPLGLAAIQPVNVIEMFPVVEGVSGTYADGAVILLRYTDESAVRDRFARIAAKLRMGGRFSTYREHDQMITVADQKNHSVCIGRSGSYIVVGLSPDDNAARSSCRNAIAQLRKDK